MNILIVGVAGFVGSSLARTLINLGHDVIGIDDFSFGSPERLSDISSKIQLYQAPFEDFSGTICDGVDALINCAAVAPLPDNQRDHYTSLRLNVALCGAIVDFCTLNGIKKIIHFSSSAVYENGPSSKSINRPASESDELCPRLAYPVSKLLSEEYLRAQSESYGLEVYALRLFNLYGPYQDYFRKQPPLIGYLIRSILKGEEIEIFASEKARRDYIYIDDLISLILVLFDREGGAGFFPLNVGSGVSYSVYDILSELERVFQSEVTFSKGNSTEFWINYPELFDRKIPLSKELISSEVEKVAIADINNVTQLTNWQPKTSMHDGLLDCVRFAREIIK